MYLTGGPETFTSANLSILYMCAMLIPISICLIFICCYACSLKDKRKNAFNSLIEVWNHTNTERGLALGLSDSFWDSVYPKLENTKYSRARDIEICENLPNIYIHLYQTYSQAAQHYQATPYSQADPYYNNCYESRL